MKETIENAVIQYWGGDVPLKASIEEKPEEIELAIKYNDHDDDFIYIKTTDGNEYLYGYFCNRYGYEDYESLSEGFRYSFNKWIRIPELIKTNSNDVIIINGIKYEKRDDIDEIPSYILENFPYKVLKTYHERYKDGISGKLVFQGSRLYFDHITWCYSQGELISRGKKYIEAKEKYGYKDWYEWSNANWGTKWNACDTCLDNVNPNPEFVSFETAWCYPEPVILKILEDNPDCLITFTWEDEDYDGTHTLIRHEDGSIEQYTDWEERHYDEEEEE